MRNFRNIAVFFVTLLLAQPLFAAQMKETKRVLIIYSLDKHHPAHQLTEQGMSRTFQENSQFEIKIYSEYLDVGRFQGADPVGAMTDLLRRKYANVKIDVIITVYPDALDFLLREKPRLFPGVPIIAAEVTRTYAETLERSSLRRRITATILGDNASGIVAAAFRFKPTTRRFALVSGSTQLDAYDDQLFRAALKREAGPIEVIDLTGLPMQETLSRVGALPRDTVVLYGSIIRDGSGQSFIPRDTLTLLSRASNAPVFGLYDTYLGHGIVGGHLVSFERQGRTAAVMALQIMAGASPENIPFAGDDAYVDLYDWRELQRWNIPETAIPIGSELRYQVPSFWQSYHWLIVGTLGLIIVETVLILGLLINIRKRKQAERSLRTSEEQIRLAADAAGAGLWSLDRGGRIVWASDRAFELYGLTKGEPATLERVLQAVHPEDRDLVRSSAQRAWETGEDINVEYRLALPGGGLRWVSVRCSASRHGPDATQHLMGACTDITARKEATEQLVFIKQSIDATPDSAFWMDVEGRVVYANDAACTNLGYHRDELLRMSVFAIAPHVTPEQWGAIWKALRERRKYTGESVHRRKDGSEFPVEVTSNYVVFSGQEYVNGFARDITERKRVEDDRRESMERYRAMVEGFDGFIYICSQDYRIEFMNRRMIERTGRNAVGEFCYRALHEKDAICEWCVNERVFQGETVHWEVQSPKDQRWYYVVNTPIRHNDGTISKQAMIQDITERKKAESEAGQLRQELAHLNRVMTMTELSSSLAHEINQPLGAILNNAAAAKMLHTQGKGGGIGEILDDIINDASRAGQIVRKIRGIIKKETVTFEVLDISSLVGEVVELFSNPLRRENIVVGGSLSPALPPVRGDRVRLQQVVMNLIMNATDAMKGGTLRVLTIRTAMEGPDKVLVSISDTGPGIDKKLKDRLFEPFFTTKKGGLGMGLRICRTILEDHGGSIRAENNPDGGATFSFMLKADSGGP
jgi:PAS domain S-box-containing protein